MRLDSTRRGSQLQYDLTLGCQERKETHEWPESAPMGSAPPVASRLTSSRHVDFFVVKAAHAAAG
jgi:hypothetical protein